MVSDNPRWEKKRKREVKKIKMRLKMLRTRVGGSDSRWEAELHTMRAQCGKL